MWVRKVWGAASFVLSVFVSCIIWANVERRYWKWYWYCDDPVDISLDLTSR